MRILIDIGHPAHVHYFKNFIKEMESRGHQFLIIAKDRSVTHYLLDYYKIKFIKRPDYPASVFLKLFKIPLTDSFVIRKCLKFRPDILMGFSGTHIAHAGWILRIPSIVIDDTDHAKLAHASYSPFASAIITPSYFRKDFGNKHLRFDGSTELFYLHPDYYSPNDSIYELLRIEEGCPYILVRFVKWNSSHDIGQKGLTLEDKIKAVNKLSESHKVFISSESALPEQISDYKINIPPERMHDVLFYADMFFGESGTMATEAAFLGTPAVDIATSALLVGVFEPFVKAGMLHIIPDGMHALDKALSLIKDDKMLAFASEIPPLLQLLPGKPTPENQSIFDYLVFNRTDQTERTFFKEIKKLQHGHKIHIRNQSVSFQRWYHLQSQVEKSLGYSSPEEFKACFSSAVGLRLRSDVPVGVCLSGGLDSSSIVAILLNDYQKSDLQTFSATYQEGQQGDETRFINELSPVLNHMHYINPTAESLLKDLNAFIKTHAEPIPSTSPYAQFKVMEIAKGKVVVTLDGQGADEELAGYHYFFGFFFKDLLRQLRIAKMTSEMLAYLIKHRSVFGFKSFLYFLLPQNTRTQARIFEKGYVEDGFSSSYKEKNSIAGNLYGSKTLQSAMINHFEYKLEHLLKWEDRNSMAFSIEARVPFLDYRLVENLLASSNDMMINKGMTKQILREAMKGQLPETIRLRKDKIGFGTPQDEWFRKKHWQTLINEVLHSDSFSNRKIVDTKKAQAIYQQHVVGKGNYSKEIWKWVHLELWFREFIDY